MKKLLSLLLLLFGFLANSQEIQLDSVCYHLNKIKKSNSYKLKIPFTNIGNQHLIIEGVQAAKSDAVGDYDKSPVKPNEKGYVEVKFMTDRLGIIYQNFIIISNSVSEDKKRIAITVKFEVVE